MLRNMLFAVHGALAHGSRHPQASGSTGYVMGVPTYHQSRT